MRELSVTIRFLKHCLGNVNDRSTGRYVFARSPGGRVLFLAAWHRANMRFAAQVTGKHHDSIGQILWDIEADSGVRKGVWFRRYYEQSAASGKRRYVLHETFEPGREITLKCVVPAAIVDDDFFQLVAHAGRYRGLSPWGPGEYGFFEVVRIGATAASNGDRI